MTKSEREYYDKIYMWARLSMSQEEYEYWYNEVSWPASDEHPEGLFYSTKEMKEYYENSNCN